LQGNDNEGNFNNISLIPKVVQQKESDGINRKVDLSQYFDPSFINHVLVIDEKFNHFSAPFIEIQY